MADRINNIVFYLRSRIDLAKRKNIFDKETTLRLERQLFSISSIADNLRAINQAKTLKKEFFKIEDIFENIENEMVFEKWYYIIKYTKS